MIVSKSFVYYDYGNTESISTSINIGRKILIECTYPGWFVMKKHTIYSYHNIGIRTLHFTWFGSLVIFPTNSRKRLKKWLSLRTINFLFTPSYTLLTTNVYFKNDAD